jgi:surfactin synthase thioesterase subunit
VVACNGSTSWLRCLRSVASARSRLICFPYSGGTADAFGAWRAAVPPDVELISVQYPGRGDRFIENALDNVNDLATAVFADLRNRPPRPTVLFGQSMGALVAYETAHLLEFDALGPDLLVVSCAPAPGYRPGGTTHLRSDDLLWDAVCALGGVKPEVAADPALRELLLPSLRADITAHETYLPPPGRSALTCPIIVYYSDSDLLCDGAAAQSWRSETTGTVAVRQRRGGHFHLWEDANGLVADLLDTMSDRVYRR